MSLDERAGETQLKTLRQLISEAQNPSSRFTTEIGTFAEAFTQTCGHNRLEQIGIRWSGVLTPAQMYLLKRDSELAKSFASYLHRVLMSQLLPTEGELVTLPRADVAQWVMALRMGMQGVLWHRALLRGDVCGNANFPPPNEEFLQSMQPVIRRAAEEFFGNVPAA